MGMASVHGNSVQSLYNRTRQDMGLPGPESIFGAVSVTQNWKFIIVRCVRLSLHTSERGGRGVPYRTVMLGIPTLHHPVTVGVRRGARAARCSPAAARPGSSHTFHTFRFIRHFVRCVSLSK
jgi:hypothetical protein